MKKFLAGLLVGLIMASAGVATAATAIKVFVNGKEVKSDVPAQIINNRTMLPVRAISEALGATVNWNASTNTVTITTPGYVPPAPTNTSNTVTAPNKMTVTVNEVTNSLGDNIWEPKAGHNYVIVKVTLKNNATTKANYNTFDFGLKDSKGNIKSSAFAGIDRDTALGYGELAPGGTVTGTIVFEVPFSESNLSLVYNYEYNKDVSVRLPN